MKMPSIRSGTYAYCYQAWRGRVKYPASIDDVQSSTWNSTKRDLISKPLFTIHACTLKQRITIYESKAHRRNVASALAKVSKAEHHKVQACESAWSCVQVVACRAVSVMCTGGVLGVLLSKETAFQGHSLGGRSLAPTYSTAASPLI